MAEGDPSLREDESVELLNGYLDQLQRGRPPDREQWLRKHPELGSTLECLEALERFAAAAAPQLASAPPYEHPTLVHLEPPPALSLAAADDSQGSADYEILEEIGRGGMGVVYKARQKSLGRVVAVKMILASHLASTDQVRRFAVEARAAAGLRHPHIVRLLDSGEIQGQPFFAMDYIAGSNLARLVARGPLDPVTAARYACQVARAVDYLHRQGIVHRDLKPSNILLDEEGEPYVTDFGLAKMLAADAQQTNTGVAAGTPSYMAPEQAVGRSSEVTPLCDVYSIGAILYELLTGRPPFQAESALDVLLEVLEREPTNPRRLNPAVPKPLEQIALKCLEKSPSQRYPSAGALADELERYLQGEAVEAAPGFWRQAQRWAKRRPALASRLVAFSLFYLVESANYYGFGKWEWNFHYAVTAILLLWVAASVLFQHLAGRQGDGIAVPFAWAAIDGLALLGLLLMANGAASPLVVGYPLLIVASGLWFRVRLIWFVTALSLVSYLVLVLDYYFRRPELRDQFHLGTDHHIFLMVALAVLGMMITYQVQRVRSLSRYYEQRRPR